ncbi:DUF6468 domain-containing protein [Geminicoccaceae bacterium 1502E]|nr:DUF6468 domain-containing protein [Geminicoccaceae bacterium 1502E]
MLQTVLELLLSLLLLVTCGWCAMLHRRLQRLRVEQEELGVALESLAVLTGRAEEVVAELKAAGSECAGLLEAISHGARHREDLGRLLESGGRMARRLEQEVGHAARLLAEVRMQELPAGARQVEFGDAGG